MSLKEDGLDIFTDAGEEKLEEKATSGILVMPGNYLISWTCRCKQDVTTLPSNVTDRNRPHYGDQPYRAHGMDLGHKNGRRES